MQTSIWAVLGTVLIILEIFTGTFVLLIFGVAALFVAGASSFGMAELLPQAGLFAGIGIGSCLLFKKKILLSLSTKREFDIDRNQTLILTEAIRPGETGRADYQGAIWSAVNSSARELKAGERVSIASASGNKLILKEL